MKIQEVIQEAHHSIVKTITIDPWSLQVDSHAIATAADRSIPLHTLTNIVSFACAIPGLFDTVPVGRGAYFQDTNTGISVYIHRLSDRVLRWETVLSPGMRPKPPLFRRPVPASQLKPQADVDRNQARMRQQTQQRGRDSVSQDLAQVSPLLQLNRADRRALGRKLKKR
jgi:hypothetical protein